MHTSIDKPGDAGSYLKEEQGIKIYCKIFQDMIPTHVCNHRKDALNTFKWSSCNGCAIGLTHYWMDYQLR